MSGFRKSGHIYMYSQSLYDIISITYAFAKEKIVKEKRASVGFKSGTLRKFNNCTTTVPKSLLFNGYFILH